MFIGRSGSNCSVFYLYKANSASLSHTTLQEHQKIVTNATLSKVSDMLLQWWSMRKLVFQVFQRIKEMCGQNYIMEKY